MKYKLTRERFELAKKWLDKIKDEYTKPDNNIESYTEYFLIICRSISDYIMMDYLGTIEPKIPLGERSEIIRQRKDYLKGRSLKHEKSHDILDFLKIHQSQFDIFSEKLLVQYFFALRNWSVHSIMPTIFTNDYEKDMKVKQRRFQKDFVYPITTENGDRLVLEDGSGFIISEESRNDSLFDRYPLNELSENERKILESILEETEAFSLLNQFLDEMDNFVKYFESL